MTESLPTENYVDIIKDLDKPGKATYFASNKHYYYGNHYVKLTHIHTLLKNNVLFSEDITKYKNMYDKNINEMEFIRAIERTIMENLDTTKELILHYNKFFGHFRTTIIYNIPKIKKIYAENLVTKFVIDEYLTKHYKTFLSNSGTMNENLLEILSYIYTECISFSEIGVTICENAKYSKIKRDSKFLGMLTKIYVNKHITAPMLFDALYLQFPSGLNFKTDKRLLKSIMTEKLCCEFYSYISQNNKMFDLKDVRFNNRYLMHRIEQVAKSATAPSTTVAPTTPSTEILDKIANLNAAIAEVSGRYYMLEKTIEQNRLRCDNKSTLAIIDLSDKINKITSNIDAIKKSDIDTIKSEIETIKSEMVSKLNLKDLDLDNQISSLKCEISKSEEQKMITTTNINNKIEDLNKQIINLSSRFNEVISEELNKINQSFTQIDEKISTQQKNIAEINKKIIDDNAIVDVKINMLAKSIDKNMIKMKDQIEESSASKITMENKLKKFEDKLTEKDKEIEDLNNIIMKFEQKLSKLGELILTDAEYIKC